LQRLQPLDQAYRPDIDGLRALAICAVIAFHATPSLLPGGYLGVDVFFVISGYLITGQILAALRANEFSIAGFYWRRARRILPALLTMLVCVLPVAMVVLMPDELRRFARSMVASAAFVPNLLLLAESGYFDFDARTKPLQHLWSLGIEEQFYLLWPVLIMLFVRTRRVCLWIGAVGVASLVLHFVVARYSESAAFFLPVTRMWELMVGALLAAAPRPQRPSDTGHVMSVSGLLLMLGSFVFSRPGLPIVAGNIVSTAGACLFIAAGPTALLNRSVFAWRPVLYIGLISYSLYLWHWPLLSFVHVLHVQDVVNNRLLRVAALMVAVAAAVATYHLIEKPMRHRKDARRLALRLGGTMAVMSVLGVVIVAAEGLPQRTALRSDPFAWPWALRFDTRCLDEYFPSFSRWDDIYCVRNDYASPPEIVLLGDSHANALWPGVRGAYAGRSLLQIGASSCPYLRDIGLDDRRLGGSRAGCPGLLDAAYASVRPETRLVILNAADTSYLATSGGDHAPLFEQRLTRDLSSLLGGGREVVLVLATPDLDFEPESCLRTRPIDRLFALREASTCTMPRSVVDTRQAAYRAVVDRAVSGMGNPNLQVVDPLDALCDARFCYAIIENIPLYRDRGHLSVQGSEYVWQRIRPHALRMFAGQDPNHLSSQ
jgi:peptidoglycan/LPS O-acetylase OafA/YrhL